MPSPFHFARTWDLDVPPDRFWATISRTGEYQSWWPWLREFDADGMKGGSRWRAVIQSPLPYVLRVELELDEVVECERMAASVTGDIAGWASLDLAASDRGSAVDVEWDMRPRSRAMQAAAVLARPLLRWSHEWVLARGLDQFQQRALSQPDDQ
ncbi:MAG: hypothetical protein JO148_14125 [Acidimicrobiia bacterium]|nr:hypothetical protein [Acidimicrobiia bacterium]